MKLSDKARQVIATVAPGLGAALGGPLGGLAGNMIADALGGADQVEQALAAQKPETLLALKQAGQAFAERMRELDIDEERLEAGDRADARALAKVDMRPHIALTALFIAGYFGLLYLLLSGRVQIPPGLRDLCLALIGVITANVPTIMAFWFGSSHGSIQKTEILRQAQQ